MTWRTYEVRAQLRACRNVPCRLRLELLPFQPCRRGPQLDRAQSALMSGAFTDDYAALPHYLQTTHGYLHEISDMRFVTRQRRRTLPRSPMTFTAPADERNRADADAPSRLTTVVVRGAGITGAGVLLTQVITFASYVVLARLAGPAVFGTFAAAWTLIGFSTIFVESGMSAALIQRKDRLEEAAATAVVSTLAAGLGLSALALVLSPVLGLYFGSREVGVIAAALAGLLFIHAASVVPDALLRRRFSIVRFGVIDPINALAYGVTAAVTLAAGLGVWGLVIATYASAILRVSVAWLLAAVASRPSAQPRSRCGENSPGTRGTSWRVSSYARSAASPTPCS